MAIVRRTLHYASSMKYKTCQWRDGRRRVAFTGPWRDDASPSGNRFGGFRTWTSQRRDEPGWRRIDSFQNPSATMGQSNRAPCRRRVLWLDWPIALADASSGGAGYSHTLVALIDRAGWSPRPVVKRSWRGLSDLVWCRWCFRN